MAENTDVWDKLGKTDPAHTKKFQRAGGFKGTAIKPIYTERKMTEVFGPCGVGWGIDAPSFQTAAGSDGQLAVYCWVSIWVNVDGKVSAPIYGVGGDMVIVKQTSGLRTDDEAFKKAFTDAVGNAMKHLGMSADVHMGLFDDSKYVDERTREEAAANESGSVTITSDGEVIETPVTKPKRLARTDFDRLVQDVRSCTTEDDLKIWWTSPQTQAEIKALPIDWRNSLVEERDAHKAELIKHKGFIPPNFDALDDVLNRQTE